MWRRGTSFCFFISYFNPSPRTKLNLQSLSQMKDFNTLCNPNFKFFRQFWIFPLILKNLSFLPRVWDYRYCLFNLLLNINEFSRVFFMFIRDSHSYIIWFFYLRELANINCQLWTIGITINKWILLIEKHYESHAPFIACVSSADFMIMGDPKQNATLMKNNFFDI